MIRRVGVLFAMIAGVALTQAAPASPGTPHPQPIDADASWSLPRVVMVDPAPFTGTSEPERVAYDLADALAPVRHLEEVPPWVRAVRAVLSEMGTTRLIDSRYGLLEAVAILQTVDNRMDEQVWNPEGRPRVRAWPGCGGDDASFATCLHPDQYRGLRQRRARAPLTTGVDPERIVAAVDIAVQAWWLVSRERIPDVTDGATSFVHRCGGSAYGEPTTRCDGDPSTPDTRGADARSGPLALKGPGRFRSDVGIYGLSTRRMIDYAPDEPPPQPGDYARYLWGRIPDGEATLPADETPLL